MEEKTLMKKIEIDLKVLAKIEREKNPNIGNFYFKVVQVDQDAEEESDDDEEADSKDQARGPSGQAKNSTAESLAQKQKPSMIEKKSADEFVQS